ncbi:MAG: PLP-dependent aminotransferase family protein [Clostridia bacterium]|nr:PLP-dependent aminotransferase family protein [Clostridia bacterium]
MKWQPDKNLSKSIYRQIVDFIKHKISTGQWPVGSKLPTQRQLAEAFDVNRSTVIEALDELKSEGLIKGKGSGGTVVINNTWSLLASLPSSNWGKLINSGIHKPNHPTIQKINKLEFDEKIIRLGTGELSPELYPKEQMQAMLKKAADKMDSLGYVEPKGLLCLREVISEYLKKFNINASPESILIVSGSLQALQLISIGLLNPNSIVMLEKPSYLKSLHVFESVGMQLKGLEMDNEGLLPNKIEPLHNRATLLYTIPTFHNPTGKLMPFNRRKKVLDICNQHRLPIIEDDAYRELWLDEEPPKPIKSLDRNGIVLYMGSLSKSLAPGLRIGWLVGPEAVIERLGDIKMQTDYGSSSLSQWVASQWIPSPIYDKYLDDLRKHLKYRRKLALDVLEKYYSDIAVWEKPKGGFYIWLKLNQPISMQKLFVKAHKEAILINPGDIYDFSNNQCIRISYSYASLSDLEHALKRLSEIIKKI